MLNQEIKEKMMRDLKIPERRARMYAKMFAERFGGNVKAITYVLTSYTPNGDIHVSYEIANKRYQMKINGSKPFSKKNRRQNNEQTEQKSY